MRCAKWVMIGGNTYGKVEVYMSDGTSNTSKSTPGGKRLGDPSILWIK